MHRTAAGNAPHRLARHALMSASALALTAILSTQPARAADECGAEGPGTGKVSTCLIVIMFAVGAYRLRPLLAQGGH